VGLPLMAEEAGVRVDVTEGGWISRAGSVGAVLGKGAGGVLGPEAVKDEGGVLSAFGGGWMGATELWRPGEVEEIVVEGLGGAWLEGQC